MLNFLEKYWEWRQSIKYPIKLKTDKGYKIHKFKDGRYAVRHSWSTYKDASNDGYVWSSEEHIDRWCKRNKSQIERLFGTIIEEELDHDDSKPS